MNGRSRSSALIGPALYTLGLGAVGVAAVAPTSPPAASRPIRATSFSCPLPVGQQVKAVKAFRAMMPVFRHPRCLNCHGGIDPLSDKHRGLDQLDPTIERMADLEKFQAQCQECHDAMPGRQAKGWITPGEPLFFTGKDDEQLCMQMKQFEHTGAEFVEHIRIDHGEDNVQFIAAAFVGDRALGEGLADYGLKPEAPPGDQPGLTKKAQNWTDVLGEEGYKASPECGCVMPKIKLEVHHTQSMEVPKGLPSKEASDVRFQVDLEPAGEDKPGFFLGEHSLTRTINMTLPRNCKGTATRPERWQLWALIDSVSGSIKVAQVAFDALPKGSIECTYDRGKGKIDPLFPLPGPGSSPGFQELLFPAESTSRTVRAGNKASNESLTITLLEVPR